MLTIKKTTIFLAGDKAARDYSPHSHSMSGSFRRTQIKNAMMWWKVKTLPKIETFMWLVQRKKILTKDTLVRKGWFGLWRHYVVFASR